MSHLFIAIGLVALAVAIDRTALWAERRGWIYWRRSQRTGSAAGSAFVDLDVFMNPGAQHLVETHEDQSTVETDADDSVNPNGKDR